MPSHIFLHVIRKYLYKPPKEKYLEPPKVNTTESCGNV